VLGLFTHAETSRGVKPELKSLLIGKGDSTLSTCPELEALAIALSLGFNIYSECIGAFSIASSFCCCSSFDILKTYHVSEEQGLVPIAGEELIDQYIFHSEETQIVVERPDEIDLHVCT
jgi:hypothetical protein